ncbi:unnamed protein product [Camellia sinensis]
MDLSKMNLNQLQVKLRECLSGKKFLIVLDAVWNENYDHWDILRSPFRYGGHGSRVIVTTRNESVSSIMQTVPIHRVQQLSDEDCWKLFAKHAFEKGDCGAHPNLESIGKEIVKKCKGLPLAAKTLAGLLRSKRDVEDWNNILKSGIWDLPKEKSNILPALRLSYHYLPSHLKRCFAYCSIFPKDYQFQIHKLVLIWMAEGFVEQPRSNKTKEEVGYEYFHELLSRSFFQQSSANKCYFVMHDLLNDLALSVSRNFCYRLEDDKPRSMFERIRHFSCVKGRFDGCEKFKIINEAKFLRTLLTIRATGQSKLWLSKKVLDDILPRLTCLRVLSLSCYEIMELPRSIGNLLHLRYLDLSHTKITQLPESEMPMQMSQLKGLQHLTAFVVGKCRGLGIEELKEFRDLRKILSISNLQNITSGMHAMEAKLEEKMYLEMLVLKWDSTTNDSLHERDVLDKLRPHTNLKRLVIKNYGGTRFPDWLEDLSFCNIVSLCLDNCEYCFSLPSLGQLPFLRHLIIARMQGITKVDHKFYGNGSLSKPFQSLEHLIFSEMLEWVEWYILGVGEFPRLRELCVVKCPKLVGGLPKSIPSLVRLDIQECSKLMAPLPKACDAGASTCKLLVLKGCDGVELEWHGISSLVKLEISNMPSLKEFTPELCILTNLKYLKIEKCPNLLSFPDTGLPPMLSHLSIINCEAIQSLPMGMIPLKNCLNNLKQLSVERCPNLVFPVVEEMENCYVSLETLSLKCCDALKSMPLGFFPKLRSLGIHNCQKFESLSVLSRSRLELQNLTSLESLLLNGLSDNMVSFTRGGLPLPNLTNFSIWGCYKLKSLPEGMHTLLPSLKSLELSNCPEIESFPEGGLPSNLSSLEIRNCSKFMARRREWNLQRLPSLRHFTLTGEYDDLSFPEDGMESFPEEWLLPSTLIPLDIEYLSNLKSLNKKGLQLLGSLKKLKIAGCPQLQSLPEEGLLPSLFMLDIFDCPMLKLHCLKEEGHDCHKIVRVPFVFIDFEAIFEQVTLGKAQYILLRSFHIKIPSINFEQ